ncbi:3-oxo-tetronate kinase [Pandoraea cepalis]|uniref:3-oxo-tetronate kinase n=1 Tax=Pandoraea cepalis TaxID=2508294 RepID=A0A5E4VND8_9BURK|nr:3-oxo-tetronate kinase [Pandoraea cepalis]VVE12824.1 HPr kinase [Pandoraea cepalis]
MRSHGNKPLLGCIADDFTGATDLANNLVRAGMRVVQTISVPAPTDDATTASTLVDADAIVVALKSRTAPVAEAVEQSLRAAQWLQHVGVEQLYFKVCSTFDSTDRGNIGPVAEALADALQAGIVPVCPAFPEANRTVYKGHLYVGDVLLSDSSMRQHPLTPMTDSNLVQVLQRQIDGKVGLVDHAVVRQGPDAVRERLAVLRAEDRRFAIVDAIAYDDLVTMGKAFAGLPLVVAGSGVAIGLPQNFGISPGEDAAHLPKVYGARAIVSGSCSSASNAQVVNFIKRGGEAYPVDPLRIAAGSDIVGEALHWAGTRISDTPVLFYATAQPDSVKAVQALLGVEQAGELVERTLSSIALGLVERGVRQLIVAGGETSGACVQALEVQQMRIGPQIDPGVPWCYALSPAAGTDGLMLTLKSGNFGTVDFFTKAFGMLA